MDQTAYKQRGFATFTATAMIVLLGMALVAITGVFTADVRRTKMLRSQAQLRQLLLAGAALAPPHLDAGQTEIPMPSALHGDASLALTVEPNGNDRRTVHVVARMEERQAEQTLTFQRRGLEWELVGAELLRPW